MDDIESKFAAIGIDRDYTGMDFSGLKEDLQGWRSDHPMFERVIRRARPKVVVEVGSWKGASVLHMHKLARKHGFDTKFICIDTWLGSNAVLWVQEALRADLHLRHGYPSMFRQFVFNIVQNKATEAVFPLPMTSSGAYDLLKRLKIVPDVVYIDAGHMEAEVSIDLRFYYELLKPGGLLFGDDYGPAGVGVVRAVNTFAAERGLMLEAGGGKFLMQKPAPKAPAPKAPTPAAA